MDLDLTASTPESHHGPRRRPYPPEEGTGVAQKGQELGAVRATSTLSAGTGPGDFCTTGVCTERRRRANTDIEQQALKFAPKSAFCHLMQAFCSRHFEEKIN